jgi:methionyl-tRNA formyltransferase
MRIVFFGTPVFAQTILSYLYENQVEIAAVVTKPDKPQLRSRQPVPSPVKQFAQEKGLPVYQPIKASDPAFVSGVLAPLKADLFIVAAFSEILKENLLNLPSLGCINVHASLLPKYRGAAPIQRCIMDGQKESGVTIMAMDVGLDTGAMYKKIAVPIMPDMTAGELADQLAQKGAEGMLAVIQELKSGKAKAIVQPLDGATYAKKLTSEDGQVNWGLSSEEVYNHIRGVTPKPGAWCFVTIKGEAKRMRILKARQVATLQSSVAKLTSTKTHPLLIGCAQGGISLLDVQLEGKKAMSAQSFINGISINDVKF